MIKIKNLKKQINGFTLFTINDLTIDPSKKTALIGRNGSGKSTFLDILSKKENNNSVFHNIKIEKVDFTDTSSIKNRILSQNGKNADDNLSPGEMYKMILESYIDDENTYLLIDEPTSHLDFKNKEEIIKLLNTRKYGYLIVSHDRDFIERTCENIIEIDQKKFEFYKGSYDFYRDEKTKKYQRKIKEYDSYKKEVKRLNKVVEGLKKRKDNIRTTPKRMGNSEARLHKMGGQENKKKVDNQIKSVKSRIDKLEVKEKPFENKEIALKIPKRYKIHAKYLVEARKLNKSFRKNIIFKNANFIIKNHSKTALIGENASGKTTLINMIIKKENVYVNDNIKIGYFSQLNEILDYKKSILENVKKDSIYDETLIRILIANLGIRKNDVDKKVSILSDGEKNKVKLAKILTGKFNLLILDEPTNFLDINTIEALEQMLRNYDGNVLFISHDKRFIRKIADHLLFIGDRKINSFEGSLDDYENRNNFSEDKMLLDYKIAKINSLLSSDISKDERERLEKQFQRLIKLKGK
ncbi:MAG: ATP-binding cassette domain-containing protein [Tissierellia bacterium]|nr:ATP-binding cassette domain-containing protein [Tissierellia bacterium]